MNKAKFLNVHVVNEIPAKDENGEKRAVWTKVGVAFPHQKGAGFNLEIAPGISVSGRLVVTEPKAGEEEKPKGQALPV